MATGQSNMTRADLIGEIAGRTGYSKAIVKTVIEEFFLVVKESLLHRISVQIRGFGSFFPKRRASKKARNIGKGITIDIPAHDVPAFKPAKDFLHSLKEQ